MPEMPSADTRMGSVELGCKEVEGLVLEIKENLRLSTMKAPGHISRKSSRASPYRVPGKLCEPACEGCPRRRRRPPPDEDPYELLQRLLRDGSLVNEAVRRLQLGLSPKQRYFYESDEESSPVLRLCQQGG